RSSDPCGGDSSRLRSRSVCGGSPRPRRRSGCSAARAPRRSRSARSAGASPAVGRNALRSQPPDACRRRAMRLTRAGFAFWPTRIYAEDGSLIGECVVERRYLVPLAHIPSHGRLAFLAAEDADFYRHRGVDPVGIARALVMDVVRHQVVQGGSTITQQVVKALLLTPERSFERKLKELVLALRLETKLSKDDILYLYLNQIYFGAGAYGVAAAARAFFDVDVGAITIAPAALL